MPNTVVINTPEKVTEGKFAISYQTNGYGGCTPVINGEPAQMLTFGYVSESDKNACIKLIEEALEATNGNVSDAMIYMRNAIMISAGGITPNETVSIDGIELLISYADKAVYEGTEMIASLDDIESEMTDEVIKALLMERARTVLAERRAEDISVYDEDETEWDY